MRSVGEILSEFKTLKALAMPGLVQDLPASFGKLWSLVEAFKIEGGVLHVASSHPALHWSVRIRKKEIVDHLRVYGIETINLKRKA